jgi:hypothetical protein
MQRLRAKESDIDAIALGNRWGAVRKASRLFCAGNSLLH